MNGDLSFTVDNFVLNIRVAALICYKDLILVETHKNNDYVVLPGGRLKALEDSKSAIKRELREELGIDFRKSAFHLMATLENFFSLKGREFHEICYVYRLDLDNDRGIYSGMENLDNPNAVYRWITHNEFQAANILPIVLKDVSKREKFKHYITKTRLKKR